jgi:hypothetical protein
MKYTYETDPAETQAMLSTLDSIFSRFIAAYTQTENRRLDMREREIQADREREARASLRNTKLYEFRGSRWDSSEVEPDAPGCCDDDGNNEQE